MANAPQNNSGDNFDMRQSNETWEHFITLSKWVIISCIIIVGGMGIFLTGH
jgi:hypothetical protein